MKPIPLPSFATRIQIVGIGPEGLAHAYVERHVFMTCSERGQSEISFLQCIGYILLDDFHPSVKFSFAVISYKLFISIRTCVLSSFLLPFRHLSVASVAEEMRTAAVPNATVAARPAGCGASCDTDAPTPTPTLKIFKDFTKIRKCLSRDAFLSEISFASRIV